MFSELIRIFATLDEAQLMSIDKRMAVALGWDDGKTISYHLGKLEAGIDSFTITPEAAGRMCEILAEVLGPNHCANAIVNEGG